MDGKTKITVEQDEGYTKILVEGHNSNPTTCAGISAIVETCKLGLHALSNSVENVEYKEIQNYFSLEEI